MDKLRYVLKIALPYLSWWIEVSKDISKVLEPSPMEERQFHLLRKKTHQEEQV